MIDSANPIEDKIVDIASLEKFLQERIKVSDGKAMREMEPKNGSGYITIDELSQACIEFGLSDVHLDEMIREIDQNNSWRVLDSLATVFKGRAAAGSGFAR